MALPEIQWSKFAVHHIVESDMDAAPLLDLPFHTNVQIRGYLTAIDEPAAQVVVEDWMPGAVIDWSFAHDELQYCLEGEVEVEVAMPPLYSEKVSARLLPGTIYLFPQGGRMSARVLGDKPYRHICFCIPNPRYPFPLAHSLADGKS